VGLIRHSFKMLDHNHDGKIDLSEFFYSMQNLNIIPESTKCPQGVRELFERFDHDGSGEIDYVEFMQDAFPQVMESSSKFVQGMQVGEIGNKSVRLSLQRPTTAGSRLSRDSRS